MKRKVIFLSLIVVMVLLAVTPKTESAGGSGGAAIYAAGGEKKRQAAAAVAAAADAANATAVACNQRVNIFPLFVDIKSFTVDDANSEILVRSSKQKLPVPAYLSQFHAKHTLIQNPIVIFYEGERNGKIYFLYIVDTIK